MTHSAQMFLRPHQRSKDGKDHIYWSLVETVRTASGPRQRTLCYLGELNGSAQARWLKSVEVSNEQGDVEQLKLFPSHVEVPDDDPQVARVLVNRVRLERTRQFGGCFLGWELWKRLGLDQFFAQAMDAEAAEVPWSRVAAVLAINRLCAPGSELAIEERWYPSTGFDELVLPLIPDQANQRQRQRTGVSALHEHLRECAEVTLAGTAAFLRNPNAEVIPVVLSGWINPPLLFYLLSCVVKRLNRTRPFIAGAMLCVVSQCGFSWRQTTSHCSPVTTNFRVRGWEPRAVVALSGRKQVPPVSLSLTRRNVKTCGYPRIARAIPCHQEGLLRHMYTARLWPTINSGSAKRYALWTRRSTSRSRATPRRISRSRQGKKRLWSNK